jgi:hypothetical protein
MSVMQPNESCAKKALEGNNQNQNKKQLRFYNGVCVRECLHISSFTEEEKHNSWYKKSDLHRIKSSFNNIVRDLSNGTWQGDTAEETSRGLEHRTQEGSLKRKANKLNSLMAVLDDQDRHVNNIDRKYVDETIAAAYMVVASKSLLEARLLAARDEIDVQELWADDLDMVSDKLSKLDMRKESLPVEGTKPLTCGAKRPIQETPDKNEQSKKIRLRALMKRIQTVSNFKHLTFPISTARYTITQIPV